MEDAALTTKVSLLERDHERFVILLEKMENNTAKLTELTSSIKQMLAVQENRLDNTNDRQSVVERRLEKHSDRLDALERWRWFLGGAIFIVGFITPIVAKLVIP